MNTKTLLQWVNPILFLFHQRRNDDPCRKITWGTEEQQTWGIEEEETWGMKEEDTSEMEEGRRTNLGLGWKKKKLLSTSLTSSTPLSFLILHLVLSRINFPFSRDFKHDQRENCSKELKLKKDYHIRR